MQKKKKSKGELLDMLLESFVGLFQKVYGASYDYGYKRKKQKNRARAVNAVQDIPLFGICQGCANNPNVPSFNPKECVKCVQYKIMLKLQDKIKYSQPTIHNLCRKCDGVGCEECRYAGIIDWVHHVEPDLKWACEYLGVWIRI